MKKKDSEITVQEASALLGVTTRSVLNYIKSKEIEAIKVGKSWFIKKPSLDSFSKRYGFTREQAEVTPTKTAEIKIPNEQVNQSRENNETKFSVKNLRAFKLSKEILDKEKLQKLLSSCPAQSKILTHFHDAVSYLGAGYYAYNTEDKLRLYRKSREKLGSALALIYYSIDSIQNDSHIIDNIEGQLLPAYSSLIKRMDKKREKS